VDDNAAVQPIFVVTGASGSGKSAVHGELARRLAGRCVTFDVDWLIDPANALSHGRPIEWSAVRDAWLSVAHGVAQAGMPTVLLGPLIPDHLANLPARRWVGPAHFLVLDCADDVRRERIEARPRWRGRGIAEQIEFARWLRAHVADRVDTSMGTVGDAATAIASWVLEHVDTADQ